MPLSPGMLSRSPVLDRPLSYSAEAELEAINTEVEGLLVVVEKGICNTVSSLDNDSIDIALVECTPRSKETACIVSTPYQHQQDVPRSPLVARDPELLLPLQPLYIELVPGSLHITQSQSDPAMSLHTDKIVRDTDKAENPPKNKPAAKTTVDSTSSETVTEMHQVADTSSKNKPPTIMTNADSSCANDLANSKPSKGIYFTNIDKNECLPVKVLTKDPSSLQPIVKLYGLERRYFCRVCHDPFVKPMTTKCGHTFCAMCIYSCTLYWRQHTCPICLEHLPSVPYLDDVIEAVVTTRLECDLSLTLKHGDLVQVLTTSSHVYAFEIGFLINIQDGYINESRQQVILPTDAQGKALNPGPRFAPSTIATVDVGGRLWFGRLADLLPFNADIYPLGTRPTRGSIVIDSRKLNLKLFDKQATKNRIECFSLESILEKADFVRRYQTAPPSNGESSDNCQPFDIDKSRALEKELYDCDLCITTDHLAKNPHAYADNFLTRISPSSQERYAEYCEELQQLPVVVTDLAEEARKNMNIDETDYICSLPQAKFFSPSEFPDYFERPDSSSNYRLFISENAVTRSVELTGPKGQENVTNICPYLSIVTNLTLWNKLRDFCCVGCKQLLRLPVKLKCGHFYCYNCAMDSLKMLWPCLGCGSCLSLCDMSMNISPSADAQYSGTNLVTSTLCPFVDISRFLPVNKVLSTIIDWLFPLHKALLDKWQPVRISLGVSTVGVVYDDLSYSTVKVLMDPDTVTTVPVSDLTPLDLLIFRPALRGTSGVLLLNTLFQSHASAYTSLKVSDGKTYVDNLEPPCDFFDECPKSFFTHTLVKIHNKSRATILARNGPLLAPLQNMINPLLATSLQFVPDFSQIIALFDYILGYIKEVKTKEENELITKQYHERYMEENNIGFVKDDLHAQRRQDSESIYVNAWKDSKPKLPDADQLTRHEGGNQRRAASIAPRSNTKKPQQAFERQRYQAQINKPAKPASPSKSLNHPFSASLAEHKDTLLANNSAKNKLAEIRKEEQRLIKLMRSDPQMETTISTFASVLKVLLKTGARDFLCSACSQVVRHPCRLQCGHLVCRSCAVTYYISHLGCLVCGADVPSVHDLFLDVSSFQQTAAYVPRHLHSEQLDKGMFVIRSEVRKSGMGIVLSTIHHIGTDYAVVRFVEGTITVRISELQIVLPKQQIAAVSSTNSSLSCLFASQITLRDSLIGSACVYWPPEDIDLAADPSSLLRRSLFGLVCDYNSQTVIVTFETGTETKVSPSHLLSLQLVGPMPKFELQRRWSQTELRAKEEEEKYARNRAIEMQIIVSLERDDVRDLELAGSARKPKPRVRIPSCRPADLGDYHPPAIFFSSAAYREQAVRRPRAGK
ncbi:putative RING finger domain protein [Giardia duodenalis assemblage B]|uniref:Putative RING finger domain protein n=1 Tax=Giardia duodenalis assemblage B TaxID=1394984 RepID=A0A132NR41_GIAIN|nr:putative RING finger domain protein [Giardia intestinalis assemblage B]